MMENFPSLAKDMGIEAQEAQSLKQDEPQKAHMPTRHIINKMPKFNGKERILKAAKVVSYVHGSSHKTLANFSTKNLQAKRAWHEIFKVMESKNLQSRLLYPAKLLFKLKGQIKSFPDKKKLKEFITTKPVL
uniref:Uncharacterized protein n=1 Tax=Rousettus aegyptiacus TaxID=9407 RepID=A0A7J8JHQ2_ROUAE|nr:hypothetical protein HJG63_010190 [Rousettus aegyptiacus]